MSVQTIRRRLQRLEEAFVIEIRSEIPEIDCDLFTVSEKEYFSRELEVLRIKARELGYGAGPEGNIDNVGWFDLGLDDPVMNEDVRIKCLNALSPSDQEIIDTHNEIVLNNLRLKEKMTAEDRESIKQHNDLDRYFRYGFDKHGWVKERHTGEELETLQLLYRQIMAKYGEKAYE
jgi:hypothetical protein